MQCFLVCSRLHLNAVAKRVLPGHTRDALFQLFCDVRTNTPKDQVFFMRHAEALKPHTFTGWLVRQQDRLVVWSLTSVVLATRS